MHNFCGVLLIEDDPSVLSLIQPSLKRLSGDESLAIASSELAAIRLLNDCTPRLIILDSAMDDTDNVDLIHFILTRPQLDSTPIILISAVPMRVAEAGLDRISDVVIKPIRLRELEYRVTQLIGSPLEQASRLPERAI